MSWKDVSMPPAVSSLPRDKRGYPIPWISEWEAFDDSPGVIFDSEGYALVGCGCEIGQGEPNLGKLCPARQRRAMRNKLCDVCGGTVDPPFIFMGKRGNLCYSESALHIDCAVYSVQVCVAIRTPLKRANFEIVLCDRYDLMRQVWYGLAPDGDVLRKLIPMGARMLTTNGVPAPTGFYMAIPGRVIHRFTVDEFLKEWSR